MMMMMKMVVMAMGVVVGVMLMVTMKTTVVDDDHDHDHDDDVDDHGDDFVQERTIILAVIPANQDISTIDILERAHRVDETGDRTIGVLTKPDLINPGGEEEVHQNSKKDSKKIRIRFLEGSLRCGRDGRPHHRRAH
jgi:hypothetical protein